MRYSRVKRKGREEIIETRFLGHGDIVIVEPGDIIPADVRFIDTINLMDDESTLTGGSQPVPKFSDPIKDNSFGNIGFSGTTVVA